MASKTVDFKEYEKMWLTIISISVLLLGIIYVYYKFYSGVAWAKNFIYYIGIYVPGLWGIVFLYQRVRIEHVNKPNKKARGAMEKYEHLRVYVSAKLLINKKILFPLIDFGVVLLLIPIFYLMFYFMSYYTFLVLLSYGGWLKGLDMMIS